MVILKPRNFEMEREICSILASRKGCTLYELKEDYDMLIGDGNIPTGTPALRDFLLTIPGVRHSTDRNGTEYWSYRSKNSAHITELVNKQKRRRGRRAPVRRSSPPPPPPQKKSAPVLLVEPPIIKMKYNNQGYLCDYQMIGDDFFLSVAKLDLGYKMQRDPETKVLSICNCVSGMTIRGVTKLLQTSKHHVGEKVIVHIGSVDILQGRDFGDIIVDYLDMVKTFVNRGIYPVLCTLPPLANMMANEQIKENLNKLNAFLRGNSHWNVFDLNKFFARNQGSPIMSLYQPHPRSVSGNDKPHLLWNRLGRQITIMELKRHLYEQTL